MSCEGYRRVTFEKLLCEMWRLLAPVCLSCFCGCVSVSVPRSAGAAEGAVMIVAGMSAPSELCLTGRGGSAQLEACADAVAAADGKRRCNAASSQHARAFVAAHVM